MNRAWLEKIVQKRNIVLLGEAGCGKSELAINLSLALLQTGKPVHLFDLDMTKPLFRSRDERQQIEERGVHFHFEEQFADAPTVTGGVVRALKDTDCYTILDVGGDYIGARAVGGYAPYVNREDTVVFYIINPFRPWSGVSENAGSVFSQILAVSHIHPEKICFIGNPNLGKGTTLEDVLTGYEMLLQIVDRDAVDCVAVCKELEEQVAEKLPVPVFPVERYLVYQW